MSKRKAVPATRRQAKQPPALSTAEATVNTDVFTRSEAASYLRMSRRQLIKLIRAGEIAEYVVNGRTRLCNKADLDAFLKAHRVEAS
jgi:excisionase family DNA binding protein